MADELLAEALGTCRVSLDTNDPSCPYPGVVPNRIMDYKAKPRCIPDQEERRKDMLARQKKGRSDRTNYARKIIEDYIGDDDTIEDMEKTQTEDMEISETKNKPKPKKEKKFNPFKNQLMLSEWLVEVPSDLASEWVIVICPIGKRCLVVANRGSTSAYTKSGYCVNRFPSVLPGGCHKKFKAGEYTILDCIFSETQRTFYVLDVMCWKGHPVCDSETEFRFFWLRTKMEEENEVSERTAVNPFVFKSVPCFGGLKEEILQAVITDHGFQVDGLLFYHKRVHYYPERTPLVGWLKPYMVHNILGVPLPPQFLENMPPVDKMTLIEANKHPYGRKKSPRKKDEKTANISEETVKDAAME